MIKSLSIQNYALIEQLQMEPSPHLNIITGETGAGKSIMLGAVGLLLGNRADTKTLFSKEKKCIVEGIFDVSNYDLKRDFEEAELDYEDECIIRREIAVSGKSRAFVNDSPVTLQVLKNLGVKLLDIHSQHETLQLANNLYQLNILDLYAGHHDLKAAYQKSYRSYQEARKQHDTLVNQARESQKDLDYKQFLFDELNNAQLKPDEQIALEEELEILENAERIKLNLAQLIQILDEDEFSLTNQLSTAGPLLSSISRYGKTLGELHERLDSASIELQDITNEIKAEQDRIELDPEKLQEVKERIDLIFRLQQKHQVQAITSLIDIQNQLEEELESQLNIDDAISKARKALDEAEKALLNDGKKLTASREKHAPKLASDITALIGKLGIENGSIKVMCDKTDPTPQGLDAVEVQFSANKGIAPQDLKHVASGGEFSRLIFAIKYLLADKTALPTIIFDEIDTGVSGEIALQMVKMMKEMSKNHQVISISHLPQFAAGGDAHYFVYKDHSADQSVSKIKKLQIDERIVEIAKMIGGDQPGENAIKSAQELLTKQ